MGEGNIISFQSFRGGTGKSNIAGNVAALAAGRGRRVGVIDSDFQSPGLHLIMGLPADRIHQTFVDHLQDKCGLMDAAYDVTHRICGENASGKCWLFPASPTAHAITQVVHEGYDVNLLGERFGKIIAELELELLLIDTHPGVNRETMLTTAVSDMLVLVLRPDQQDYQGTALFLEIARKLAIPKTALLLNKLYSHIDEKELRERVERTFESEVVGMLPLSEDLARNESRGLFCLSQPEHAITKKLSEIADRLTGQKPVGEISMPPSIAR